MPVFSLPALDGSQFDLSAVRGKGNFHFLQILELSVLQREDRSDCQEMG